MCVCFSIFPHFSSYVLCVDFSCVCETFFLKKKGTSRPLSPPSLLSLNDQRHTPHTTHHTPHTTHHTPHTTHHTPHDTTLHYTAQHHTTPHHTTPHHTTPHHRPGQARPGQARPGQARPGHIHVRCQVISHDRHSSCSSRLVAFLPVPLPLPGLPAFLLPSFNLPVTSRVASTCIVFFWLLVPAECAFEATSLQSKLEVYRPYSLALLTG